MDTDPSPETTIYPNLNSLQSGIQITGYQNYILDRYLGEGLTAVIWLATILDTSEPVALKILRPDASEITQVNFWNESLVLSELKNNKCLLVPSFYESQKKDKPDLSFIALEYIDPSQFASLDSVGVDNYLDEQEVLEIASQALDLLHRLHSQVGRTYTDMQLKNFLWNKELHQLKVIDWNHVSIQKEFINGNYYNEFGVNSFEELAQRDISRLAVYIYKMLTGMGAYEKGEMARLLEKRGGEAWKRLSLVTRNILSQALHPNPDHRFGSAIQFRAAIQNAQQLWQISENEIIKIVYPGTKGC